jgi:Na+-transporting NADH:ubiquinone oxidoreductase subunit NqrD
MRPVGITIVAILNWLRASVFALVGMALIVVGHLSGRLVTAMGSGPLAERLLSGVGKVIGFGALLIAVLWLAAGIGLWTLQGWGRLLTVALTGLWLFFGLLGLLHHPFPTHILRVVVDGAIIVYLSTPEVRRLFLAR